MKAIDRPVIAASGIGGLTLAVALARSNILTEAARPKCSPAGVARRGRLAGDVRGDRPRDYAAEARALHRISGPARGHRSCPLVAPGERLELAEFLEMAL
jgi:hypothetical protein